MQGKTKPELGSEHPAWPCIVEARAHPTEETGHEHSWFVFGNKAGDGIFVQEYTAENSLVDPHGRNHSDPVLPCPARREHDVYFLNLNGWIGCGKFSEVSACDITARTEI